MKAPAELILTLEERALLSQALANDVLVSALAKVLAFEQREQDDRMRQEALSSSPNVQNIVQYAAKSSAATEFFRTVKMRMDALTIRSNG